MYIYNVLRHNQSLLPTQNTHNAMTAQPPEVSQWQEWCLEHTCTMLQCSFPAAAVWIVRPSRMLRQMFSCFHNFVQSSLIGVPTYNTTYGCLLQLEALLKDAIQNAIRNGHLDMDVHAALNLPVVLVGFSKGCVVLNQIVHELVNYVIPRGLQRSRHFNLSVSTPSMHSGQRSAHSSPTPPRSTRWASPEVGRRTGDSSNTERQRDSTRDSTERLKGQHSLPELSVEEASGNGRPRSADSRSRLSSTSSTRSERGATPERALLQPYRSSSFGAPASKHILKPTETDVRNITMFLRRLKGLYWLDAGHSGGHGAWVTDSELLSMLAGLGVTVWVHVTPQQVRDPHRVWIGEEQREFVDKLRGFGATVHETMHFENEERSLDNHFRVLTKL